MSNKEGYYVGTDLKFAINITASGFNMNRDDYDIKIVCGNRTKTVTQDDIVEGDNNTHYLLIDTSEFSGGLIKLIVTAKVPDDDFENDYRREVTVHDLCYVKKT